MTSGATALDLLFVGLAATLNHQCQRRNIDLFGYQHSIYFPILVYLQKFATEANNYPNIIIIISLLSQQLFLIACFVLYVRPLIQLTTNKCFDTTNY